MYKDTVLLVLASVLCKWQMHKDPLLTVGVRSMCRRVTVVCLVNYVLCIVISRTASPGVKVTTKMNSTGYLYQDRRVVFYIMP